MGTRRAPKMGACELADRSMKRELYREKKGTLQPARGGDGSTEGLIDPRMGKGSRGVGIHSFQTGAFTTYLMGGGRRNRPPLCSKKQGEILSCFEASMMAQGGAISLLI